MNKAKDCQRSIAPWLAICLSLFLSVVEAGCSGMTGFRSVGTERPSFLGFWDRSGAGSPTPENDSYVMSMRAGQARADVLAKRDGASEAAPGSKGNSSEAGKKIADSGKRSNPPNRALPDNTTIRVSLGRPEPLPGLANRTAPGVSIASKGPAPASQWKADTESGPSDRERDLGLTAEGNDAADRELPTRVADRSAPAPAPAADWKEILSRAEDRLDALRSYQMKVSRIERVNGQLQPEEDILLSIRRDPKAVRLEWSSGPSKGREVIYASNLDPRTLFVHMASTAIPLPVMKIAVDSPMVMRNSRHSITDAGLETIVENLRKAEPGGDKTQPQSGVLSYRGTKKPAGLDRTCHHFVRRTPAGETWNVYLDERSLLPSMVFAEDSHGQMIERYVYREIRQNPADLALASAFDPNQRWGEPKGLLGRLARAASGTDLPGDTAPKTR
jgi:hypothetical protein